MAMQNLVACVVGLSNNTKEQFATRPGIGKSCLCFRFAYPGYDKYIDAHPSILALHEFESPVINSAHFLYWGSPLKEFPVKGGEVKVRYHLLEHTVFYQDVTSYPFNPMVRPDDMNYYIKRITGSIESPGKHSYYTRDDIGPSDRYTKFQYPVHLTKQVRGYVVAFDVSLTDEDMDMQCSRVMPILDYLCKKKRPVVLAATKKDTYKIMSMQKAQEIQRKFHIPLVETSANENLNVDEVFRVLAKLVLGKKVHGLSDQVQSYDEAAKNSLHQRGSAKRSLKSYLEKKCTMYIERLDSIQKTEEYKECSLLIGDFQAGYLFVQNQLRLYNEKVDTFDGVAADPMMRQEFLEDFVESRSDFKPYKKELRLWISDHIEHCQATQPPPPPPPLIQNVTADAPPEPYHFFQSKSKIAQEEKSTVEVESLVNSEPKQESTNISSESSDDDHDYLNYDPKNPLMSPGLLTEDSASSSLLPPTFTSSAERSPVNSMQTPPAEHTQTTLEQAFSPQEQVSTSQKQAPSLDTYSEQASSVQTAVQTTFLTTRNVEESSSQEEDFHDYENFDPSQLPQLNSAGADREYASQPSGDLSPVKETVKEQEQQSPVEQPPLELPSDGQEQPGSPSSMAGPPPPTDKLPPLVLPKPRKASAPSMEIRNGPPDTPPDLTSKSPKLSEEGQEATPTQAKVERGRSIKLRAKLLEGVMKGGKVEDETDNGGNTVSEGEPASPAKTGEKKPSLDSQFSGSEPESPSRTEPPGQPPVRRHSRVAPPPPVSDDKRKPQSPDLAQRKRGSPSTTKSQTGSTSSSGSASPVLSPSRPETPPHKPAPMGMEENASNLRPKLSMIKQRIAEKKALSPPSEDKATRIDEIKRKLAENKKRKSMQPGAEVMPLPPPVSDGDTGNSEAPPIPSRMLEKSKGLSPTKPPLQSPSRDATFAIVDDRDGNGGDSPKTLVSLRKKISQRSQPDNHAEVKEEKPTKKFGLFSRSTKEKPLSPSPSPKRLPSNKQDSKISTKRSPVKSTSLEEGASSRAQFLNMSIRPLPPLPGHSRDPDASPDHTDADYELFTHDDMYINYPGYPLDPTSVSMRHAPKKDSAVRRWSSFGSKDKHAVNHGDRALPPRSEKRTLPPRDCTLLPPRAGNHTPPAIPSGDNTLPSRTADSTRAGATPTGNGEVPDYIDGYVNANATFSPTKRGLDRRPLPKIPVVPPSKEGEDENEDTDYSYPDIHGALMFRSTQSTKIWMAKMRHKIRQESLPNSVTALLCDGAKERLTRLNENYLDRCRTASNASSDYVPMNGAQDDTYVNYSSMSTRQPVTQSLPPRRQLRLSMTSSSSTTISSSTVPPLSHSPETHPPKPPTPTDDGEKQYAMDDLTIYMNLPTPEKPIPLPSRHTHAMTLPRRGHVAPPPVAARPKAAGTSSSPVKKVPPPTKPKSVTVHQISAVDRDTTLPLEWTLPQSSTPPITESDYQNFDVIDPKLPPKPQVPSLDVRIGPSQLPPRDIMRH